MGTEMVNTSSVDVLGIVGCVVLADELTYVLSLDRELHGTFVVVNEAGRTLMKKLARGNHDAELVPLEGLDKIDY